MRVPSGFTHLRDELCAEPPPDDRAPRTVSVYDHAGVEFVLVPAAEGVELGWDGGLAGLADRVVESLADDLDRVLHPLEGHRRWLAEIDPDEEPEAAAWLADQVARYEAEGDPEFDDATRARFTLDGFAAMVDEVTSPRRRVDLPAISSSATRGWLGSAWSAPSTRLPATGTSARPTGTSWTRSVNSSATAVGTRRMASPLSARCP